MVGIKINHVERIKLISLNHRSNNTTGLIYALLSVGYLVLMLFKPFPADWLAKIAPLLWLFYVLIKNTIGWMRPWILAAITFSMCGDILLNLDQFVPGLVAFLIAQLIYLRLFVSQYQHFTHRWLLSVSLVILMLIMATVLMPRLGDLRIPVMMYLIVIGAMGISSIMSNFSIKWLVTGTLVFIVSDSLIAVNEFINPFYIADWLVMITYYIAQYAILMSLMSRSIETVKKASH